MFRVYKETIIREPQPVLSVAQITHLVKNEYVELVQDVISVMAAYCDLWGMCTVHCVTARSHSAQCTRLTGHIMQP